MDGGSKDTLIKVRRLLYKSENLSLGIFNMLHIKVPSPREGRRSG